MGRGSDSLGSSRRSRTPTPPMTPPGGTRRMSAQLKSIEAELTKMTQEVRLDTEASNKALVRSLMGTTEAPQSAKEEEKSKTVCSQCGTKYKEDAKHCKRCGNKRPEEKKAQQTKRIIPSDFFLDLSQEVDELLKGVLRDSGAKEVKSPFMSRPGTSPEKEQEHRAQMTPPLTDGDRTPKSATPRTIGPTDTVTTIYPEGQQGDGASVQEESPSGTKRSLPEQNPSKGFSETGITEAETAADSPEKGGVGFQNWLRTGNEDDEEDMTPGGLLNFSTQDLLEDLRGAESLTWAEQRHAEDEEAERALALASMAEEKHFWEVDRRELSEDQENFYEIEQAIWRLRKWLRKKYGSAEKAWKVLETTCTAPWSKGKDKAAPVQARAADCLTFAEIKIAMSRLGINLPHITGYEKVKTLLQAIDDNGSRNITFRELMGDDDDPTILHEEPPPEKIPWETGLVQPRWATRWESGLFDKELEEHCITRDAHRPTRPKFDTSNAKKPDGYVPIYKRYKKVMEEKMAFKKKSYEMRRAKEMEGCTFAPNFVKRSRSAPAEPTTKKEGELSYRNKNLIEYLAKKEKDSEKCTFRPELCQRSNQIIALMRGEGGSAHERLASRLSFHERRFGNHAEDDVQIMTFKPDISASARAAEDPDIDIHPERHKKSGNIHERLFHHDKGEYWHGHEHWHEKHKEDTKKSLYGARMFSDFGMKMGPTSSRMGSTTSMRGSRPESAQSTPALLSSRASESEAQDSDDDDKPLTVEYRSNLLGLMEACERWGSHVNKEFAWALADPSGGKSPRKPQSTTDKESNRSNRSSPMMSRTGSPGRAAPAKSNTEGHKETGVKQVSRARSKKKEATRANPIRQTPSGGNGR